MKNRPRIKLNISTTDIIIEIIGWLMLASIWVFTVLNYNDLNEVIPTHYNAKGEADAFGNKANIFQLPMVITILFIGMTILNRFPHIFNYPVEITAQNAKYQYENATRLIRMLKLVFVFIFGVIIFETVGNKHFISIWFLPLLFILIFTPIIYYLIKSSKG
ncbi:MAG: hypothetical protein CSA38_04350 [Flavobacteriales bacterium]|nr:MAG: hypothetical protein CSA38_04350 [Flavobacteriales bacterium]